MSIIDQKGKFFGFINIIDLSILIIFTAFCAGFLWIYTGHSSLNKVIKAKGMAEVKIIIKGARIEDLSILKRGEKPFITIRNEPYANVEIVDIKSHRRKISFLSPDGKDIVLKDDPVNPYVSDIEITIRDQATLTTKGIIMGGKRMKVGVPIELEGFFYRMRGSIINVRMPGVTDLKGE